MSEFAVKVRKITHLVPIVNDPKREKAIVDGIVYVVRRGDYGVGEHVIVFYVESILPERLMKEIGFWDYDKNKGLLDGKNGDRIVIHTFYKDAKKLDSFGLLIKLNLFDKYTDIQAIDYSNPDLLTDINFADFFGVKKWEEVQDETESVNSWYKFGINLRKLTSRDKITMYDIEAIMKFPFTLIPLLDRKIVVMEKVEGSNWTIEVYTDDNGEIAWRLYQRRYEITPQSDKTWDDINYPYYRVIKKTGILDKLARILGTVDKYGEVVTRVVYRCELIANDVHVNYYNQSQGEIDLYGFELGINEEYLSPSLFIKMAEKYNLQLAPILFSGGTLADYLNACYSDSGFSVAELINSYMAKNELFDPYNNAEFVHKISWLTVETADGISKINPELPREGIVIRDFHDFNKVEGCSSVILKQRGIGYMKSLQKSHTDK